MSNSNHSQPPASGLIRIGRSPVRSSLPFILGTCVPASLLIAWPTMGLFGSGWPGYLMALALWLAVLPGGILLGLAWWYRPVAFDLRAGTARLGRTTVPLSTVTSARREITIAQNGRYLSYRFGSSSGARGRVLVAGRPLRGLDEQGRARLAQFVAATGIREPADQDGLTPQQRVLADQLSQHSVRSAVGKQILLAELRGDPAPALPAGPVAPTAAECQQDDLAAAAFLAGRREVGRTARRVFGWLIVAAVLAAGGVIVAAVVLEQQAPGGRLDDGTNARIGIGVLVALVAGVVAYLGFCLASLVHLRQGQRQAWTWLRSRDGGQLQRGLPPVLLAPFLGPTPGQRLATVTWLSAAVLGGVGLLTAMATLFPQVDPPPGLGTAALVIGIAGVTGAIWLYLRTRRAKRRQDVLAAQLAGARVLLE